MRHSECIFAAEEDCPKLAVELTCEDCGKHKVYETIEQAIRDYTSLGEAFTEIFAMFKTLIDGNGTTVSIETPTESFFVANRVMTTLLSENDELSVNERYYRRLTFYFFSILIDEFKTEEYGIIKYLN